MKIKSKLLLVLLSISWSLCSASSSLIPWSPNFASLPRRCKVKTISKAPYILCIYDFVTDKEARHIKKISNPLMKRSLVIGADQSETECQDRTSSSAFLHEVPSKIVKSIRERSAVFANTIIDNIEHLQVVHYRDSQRYDPHYDYFDRSLASAKDVIGAQGQRIATALIYLNDVCPDAGGETCFPKVLDGLKVRPKKNMAVFWFNVLPDGTEDDRTLHGGLPIKNGEKWAINVWIRDPRLVEKPA